MDDLDRRPATASAASRQAVAFVLTDTRHLSGQYLPAVTAARAMNLEVTAVVQRREHRAAVEAAGIRAVSAEVDWSAFNPMTAGYGAGRLSAILKDLKADIVHCVGARAVVVGGTAAIMAGIVNRVYVLCGPDEVPHRPGAARRLSRLAFKSLVRGVLESRQTRYILDGDAIAGALSVDPRDPAVTVIDGPAFDLDDFTPTPLPPTPPLKLAYVGALVAAEGVDDAVEALWIARARGVEVELSLYDASTCGSRSFTDDAREARTGTGVVWRGPARDTAEVLVTHHVACLFPRAAEGLPRSLLDAAACGRAVLTTDVPGCRDLVRDGIDGVLVPASDVKAIAAAYERLARDPVLVARLGEARRRRAIENAPVTRAVAGVYAELLSR